LDSASPPALSSTSANPQDVARRQLLHQSINPNIR
jgi:hypothetical protein